MMGIIVSSLRPSMQPSSEAGSDNNNILMWNFFLRIGAAYKRDFFILLVYI
jgi:hypothetical protein